MNLNHINYRLSRIGIHLERGLKLKGGKIKSTDETLQYGLNQLKRLSNPVNFKMAQIDHNDTLNIPVFQFKSKPTSTGKGLDEDLAKASAVMEFMERYSWKKFQDLGRENMREATINELDGIGFSEGYFYNNLIENSVIKENFDKIKNLKMRWVKAYSLSNDRYIHYPLSWHNAVNLSNGLASGNSFAEAMVQATCEVIERHVYSELIYSDRTPPSIEVNPSQFLHTAKLMKEFESHGVRLVLKDMTDSMGIPSFLAWAHDDSFEFVNDVCGVGTHLSPETAAVRAISKCAQARSLLLQEVENFPKRENLIQYYKRKNKKGWMLFNTDDFYKRMSTNTHRINLSDIEDLQCKDVLDDLNILVSKLKEKSHEIFVINKTHPELCVPTIRMFIPTLKYYIASDIPISLDSVLGRIYLETYDITNAVSHFRRSGNESLLKKAYILDRLRGSGIPPSECPFKLENVYKGNMINQKETYCLGKDIEIKYSPANGKTSLLNKKTKQSVKISSESLIYLRALERKNIEQVIEESKDTVGFDKYQLLDFLDSLLFTGFIQYKNVY